MSMAQEVRDAVPLTLAVERLLQQFLEETKDKEAPMDKREIEDTILRIHRQHLSRYFKETTWDTFLESRVRSSSFV